MLVSISRRETIDHNAVEWTFELISMYIESCIARALAGEIDARRVDFNRSETSARTVVAAVNYPSSLSTRSPTHSPPPHMPVRVFLESTARSLICFPRFTFHPFFSFALDVLRWAGTCILVSSLRRSTLAKGIYLKLTSRESRALFGAPFSPVPALPVRPRAPPSLSLCSFFPSAT